MQCSRIGRTTSQRSRPACGSRTHEASELRRVRPEASTGSDQPTSQAELHIELESLPGNGEAAQRIGTDSEESGAPEDDELPAEMDRRRGNLDGSHLARRPASTAARIRLSGRPHVTRI
jgi:hypothetical protein